MRPAVKAGQKQYINFGKDQIMERKMKIGWGCDYTGVAMKGELMAYMAEKGYENVDFGGYDASNRKDDYPGFGRRVGEAVASGEVDQGVLICGTGIGISLTANKVPGIRAAVCSEPYSAAMAKRHNNAQIIAFGARVIGVEMAKMILDSFFGSEFEGGRHAGRVERMMQVDADYGKGRA